MAAQVVEMEEKARAGQRAIEEHLLKEWARRYAYLKKIKHPCYPLLYVGRGRGSVASMG